MNLKPSWLNELPRKGRRVYSQDNQDGYLEFIFKNIGTTNKICVEFGFNTITLAGGTGANCARLVIEDGWHSILFDGTFENKSINLHKEWLTPKNLPTIFSKYKVPAIPDYVSIDVDSVDLWLFRSMLLGGYRPRVVSVEYNANFPVDINATLKRDAGAYANNSIYGASLLALVTVADEFDYKLICVEKQLDLFFIRGNLVSGLEIPAIQSFASNCDIPSHRLVTEPMDMSYFTKYRN